MISIRLADPDANDSQGLLDELSAVLVEITGDSGQASFDAGDVRASNARFVVARDADGNELGCGAFRPLQSGVAEIKRMYSRPGTTGVGTAILSFLETEARHLGYRALRLETRLVNQRAVIFYERKGYQRIQNYGKYAGNPKAVCFEKLL
jgi:GNAT superfamily N-acetyltransferase